MFTVISVNQPRRQLFQQADHLLWKCPCSLSVFHQWYVWWGLSALHSLVTVPGGVSYTVVNHTFHLPFHLTYLSVLPRLALPSLFLLQRRVTEFLHPYYSNDFVVKTYVTFSLSSYDTEDSRARTSTQKCTHVSKCCKHAATWLRRAATNSYSLSIILQIIFIINALSRELSKCSPKSQPTSSKCLFWLFIYCYKWL